MRKLLIFTIGLLLSTTCYAGEVSHWKMNDDAANSTVTDSYGSNNGTYNGAIIEDFEDGSLDADWEQTTNFSIEGSSPTRDSYSAGQDSGNSIDAIWAPSELSGGKQVDRVEFYWQETTNQSGFTVQFVDSSGNDILQAGGNNPQWELSDGDGSIQPNTGDGYDRWILYRFDFDWDSGEYTYYMEDQSSSTSATGTRSLSNNTDLEKIKINNSNGNWGSADHMWFDDIKIECNINTSTGSVTGKINNAIDFDGSDERVECSNFLGNVFSMSVWCKTPDDGYRDIFGSTYYDYHTNQNGWWSAIMSDGNLYTSYGDGTNKGKLETSLSLEGTTFRHIVVIVDANNGVIKHYVDGNLEQEATGLNALTIDHGDFWIGHAENYVSGNPVRGFNGSLDDVRIYDHALTEREVDKLYHYDRGSENELDDIWLGQVININ